VKFEYVWMLNFLLIIPLIVFLFVIENRKKKRTLYIFAQPHLLPFLTRIMKKSTVFFKCFLFTFSIALLIIALSGPKWGSHYQDVQRKGVDIIFLLDVSKSMLAEDVKPERLERAKREITDFLKVAEGDRVGLVVFAGDAFVQCPLTLDYEAISMFVDSVDTDSVPVMGTDMGAGINAAVEAFDYKSATDKVIVMITDGEDNEREGFAKALKAKDRGVKIFVYGIGEANGAPIPDNNGGFKKDDRGNLILSKLDESNLTKIADITGGKYVRSVTGDLDLDRLYFDGIKKRTKAKELKEDKIKVYEERFPLFIALALFCMMIEVFIDFRFTQKSVSGLIIFCLIFIFRPYAFGKESGEYLYRKGLFKEAEEAFLKKDMEDPKDVRNRYNRGCASFKNSNFKGAQAAFESVLRRTDKKNIKFNAAFNLGNALYMNKDYVRAAKYFREAVKLDPEDEDARYNYELAKKTLKEFENKKESQTEKSGGQKREDDQNKKQEDEKKDREDKQHFSEDNDRSGDGKKDDGQEQKNNNDDKQKDQDKNGKYDQNNKDRTEYETGDGNMKKEGRLNDSGGGRKDFAQSDIDKKDMTYNEAEAFIDNVTEDPKYMNRLRFKDKGPYAKSKKDW